MDAKINHSIPEACDRLGAGRSTLYRLIADGEIAVVKIGRRTLVPETSLQAFQAKLLAAAPEITPEPCRQAA